MTQSVRFALLPDCMECQVHSLIDAEPLSECPSHSFRLIHRQCRTTDDCNRHLCSNQEKWSAIRIRLCEREGESESLANCNWHIFWCWLLDVRTFCDARFCINISPCELNKNTLNARCNLTSPSTLTRWQSRFVDWPIGRSYSSTRIQFSSSAISCRFFVSNLVADTKCRRDVAHALFTKCVNAPFNKRFVIIFCLFVCLSARNLLHD